MENKLDFKRMENIEGGGCAGSIATFAFGFGGLLLLSGSMGVGAFAFTAAGGWYGLISGAQGISEYC
jgi:hypothetical protein